MSKKSRFWSRQQRRAIRYRTLLGAFLKSDDARIIRTMRSTGPRF